MCNIRGLQGLHYSFEEREVCSLGGFAMFRCDGELQGLKLCPPLAALHVVIWLRGYDEAVFVAFLFW